MNTVSVNTERISITLFEMFARLLTRFFSTQQTFESVESREREGGMAGINHGSVAIRWAGCRAVMLCMLTHWHDILGHLDPASDTVGGVSVELRYVRLLTAASALLCPTVCCEKSPLHWIVLYNMSCSGWLTESTGNDFCFWFINALIPDCLYTPRILCGFH